MFLAPYGLIHSFCSIVVRIPCSSDLKPEGIGISDPQITPSVQDRVEKGIFRSIGIERGPIGCREEAVIVGVHHFRPSAPVRAHIAVHREGIPPRIDRIDSIPFRVPTLKDSFTGSDWTYLKQRTSRPAHGAFISKHCRIDIRRMYDIHTRKARMVLFLQRLIHITPGSDEYAERIPLRKRIPCLVSSISLFYGRDNRSGKGSAVFEKSEQLILGIVSIRHIGIVFLVQWIFSFSSDTKKGKEIFSGISLVPYNGSGGGYG